MPLGRGIAFRPARIRLIRGWISHCHYRWRHWYVWPRIPGGYFDIHPPSTIRDWGGGGGGGAGGGAWFIIHIGIGGDIRTARSPIVPTVIRRCDKIRMIVCWVATNVSVSTLLKRNIKLARQHSYYHNQWSPTHPAHASGAVEPHCN